VLVSRKAMLKLEVASLTKIMTCFAALDILRQHGLDMAQ
jgi:D-alanyl-D-alanine carboxypeptidase (penicillin-binding protein 5/6)